MKVRLPSTLGSENGRASRIRGLVRDWSVQRSPLPIVCASALFLILAPLLSDSYNSLNQRGFLDLILKGNPFGVAGNQFITFRGRTWILDWPYPPLTILVDLPAWILLQLTRSEAAYQLMFKLPLFVCAVITQIVMQSSERSNRHHPYLVQLYLFNPAVLLLTTISGGFETLSAMLILVACLLYTQDRKAWSAVSLGLAGALRLYPFLLVPLFMLNEWRRSHSMSEIGRYLAGSFAPLILSCLPFVLADWKGFLSVLQSQQSVFGPFASINFVSVLIYPLFRLGGWLQQTWVLVDVSVILTVAGLVGVYVWSAKRGAMLIEGSLLALLVFFLFYPKVHGLYTISLLPLALMLPSRYAVWVWVPGAVWMLFVNGAFGATGLAYWLAPAIGKWIPLVTSTQASMLTFLLSGVQMFMIIGSIAETMRVVALSSSQPGKEGIT